VAGLPSSKEDPSILVACGDFHTVALTASGRLMSWGHGPALGHNTEVSVDTNAKRIAEDGNAYTRQQFYEFFGGFTEWNKAPLHGDPAVVAPKLISALFDVPITAVACGAEFTVVAAKNGDCYSWGKAVQGELGHGNFEEVVDEPRKVQLLASRFVSITGVAVGGNHTIVVDSVGDVWAWGLGDSGQLGLGDLENRCEPVQVPELRRVDVADAKCGWWHSMVISRTGGVYTWGSGVGGRLGHGDTEHRVVPTQVWPEPLGGPTEHQ